MLLSVLFKRVAIFGLGCLSSLLVSCSPLVASVIPLPVQSPPPAHSAAELIPTATSLQHLLPSSTPPPSQTVTPLVTAVPQPSPTPACGEQSGRVVEFQIASSILNGEKVPTNIYFPPCYTYQPQQRYPVLYLLHGLGHDQNTWSVDIGINQTADRLLQAKEIAPLIIVMPQEYPTDEHFDRVLNETIVPFVDQNFRTYNNRSYRALGGVSRGAGIAMRIGLQAPQIFGMLGFHSLAILRSDDAFVSKWVNSVPRELSQHYFIDIGSEDSITVSAFYLHNLFLSRDIAHEYLFVEGGEHSIGFWAFQSETYLRWYNSQFGHPAFVPTLTPDNR